MWVPVWYWVWDVGTSVWVWDVGTSVWVWDVGTSVWVWDVLPVCGLHLTPFIWEGRGDLVKAVEQYGVFVFCVCVRCTRIFLIIILLERCSSRWTLRMSR